MRIVVLGAGLIGVTSAWYLAKAGHQVTVIDRHAGPAEETSFANAGLIVPGHAHAWASPRAPGMVLRSLFRGDQALRLRLRFDPEMWAWCWKFLLQCTAGRARRNTARKVRLCRYSQIALNELVRETGIEYHRRNGGVLYLYREAEALARGAAALPVLRDAGVELEVLDRAAAVRIEPALAAATVPIAGAIHGKSDESGDARLFTLNLAERCRAAGVAFKYRTPIRGFGTEGGRVDAVDTELGAVAGDAFVVALGVGAARPLRPIGIRVPVYPVKGYSLTMAIRPQDTPPTIGGIDEHHLFAFSRLGDRLRVTATAEFAGYDASHRPADFAAMLRAARELFPKGADFGSPSYWACLRPMTPEGTPIIGATRYPNLFLNVGHGHLGWTMACGSARLLASVIDGREPDIDMTGLTLPSRA